MSSRPCLETNPHSILRAPFAGHCLGGLSPAELSEGVNRVFRTLSGDTPLPILQTPSAGHCLDAHGLQDSARVVISLFLARNCCRLAVVMRAILAS